MKLIVFILLLSAILYSCTKEAEMYDDFNKKCTIRGPVSARVGSTVTFTVEVDPVYSSSFLWYIPWGYDATSQTYPTSLPEIAHTFNEIGLWHFKVYCYPPNGLAPIEDIHTITIFN